MPSLQIERLLAVLKAAGETTRLRVLAVLAICELTVTELTTVLGQSQPGVSRHLKLLHEAGLIDRYREGSWVFYRLRERGDAAGLAATLGAVLDATHPMLAGDRARLEEVRATRARAAAEYFGRNAREWDRLRSLYADAGTVEAALLEAAGPGPFRDLLDIGTGTARVLELFAPRVAHGVGIDLSREMLALGRAKLDRAELRHCQVRHGDLYRLPAADRAFDLVTMHQVLHYLDDPRAAIAEATRVLADDGTVLVVDLAPHEEERLREAHAHRRLGFGDEEMHDWFRSAGLDCTRVAAVAGKRSGGRGRAPARLEVRVWRAARGRKACAPPVRAHDR